MGETPVNNLSESASPALSCRPLSCTTGKYTFWIHVHSYFTHSYGFLSCPSRPPLWKNALHAGILELALEILHGWVIARRKCHVKFSRGTAFTREHVEWQWQWSMKSCATQAARQSNLFAMFCVDALHGIAFPLMTCALSYNVCALRHLPWSRTSGAAALGPEINHGTTSDWSTDEGDGIDLSLELKFKKNSQQHIPPSKAYIHPNNTHTHTHTE